MRTDNSLSEYYEKIESILSAVKTDKELFTATVNAPFDDKLHTTSLDLGIVVLLLLDKKTGNINRIAFSNTEPANVAIKASPKPFQEIKIPLDAPNNITAKAIRNKKHYMTSDWQYILSPAISPAAARFNQAESGMDCSAAYPLTDVRDGGVLLFSFYQPSSTISAFHHAFMKKYTEIVATHLKK